MRRKIKRAMLVVLRACGLFALARHLTRKQLRILCFHGGSINDEHEFMPGLFMRPAVFRQRLEHLARGGYAVLGLADAVERLRRDDLPPLAVVLTIDDGFYSTFHDALGPLGEFKFPCTVYVTTYHVAKGTPIFRLVVQYAFWKTRAAELNCDGFAAGPGGVQKLATAEDKKTLMWKIITPAEARLSDDDRCRLAEEIGKRLGVDYREIAESRAFSLMTPDEIRRMSRAGIDVQLHTHRHRFPVDRAAVEREIADNRAFLAPLVERPLDHLCYPSGIYSPEQWPWLEDLGVASGTTCELGLCTPTTPPFGLPRFCDFDDISPIEFDAELSGVGEYLRRARTGVRRLLGRGA